MNHTQNSGLSAKPKLTPAFSKVTPASSKLTPASSKLTPASSATFGTTMTLQESTLQTAGSAFMKKRLDLQNKETNLYEIIKKETAPEWLQLQKAHEAYAAKRNQVLENSECKSKMQEIEHEQEEIKSMIKNIQSSTQDVLKSIQAQPNLSQKEKDQQCRNVIMKLQNAMLLPKEKQFLKLVQETLK
jgi:hypothetical protein